MTYQQDVADDLDEQILAAFHRVFPNADGATVDSVSLTIAIGDNRYGYDNRGPASNGHWRFWRV